MHLSVECKKKKRNVAVRKFSSAFSLVTITNAVLQTWRQCGMLRLRPTNLT
jgi:hypothetical protein